LIKEVSAKSGSRGGDSNKQEKKEGDVWKKRKGWIIPVESKKAEYQPKGPRAKVLKLGEKSLGC